jgi:3-hydroxyacyl-CoA dehydrogenase/enoyl-CoA hydratase/3-hydroxybutyryl-CoA epimerase
MMLTGRALRAKEALRLKLVDEVVPPRHLMRAARAFVLERPRPARAPWYRRVPSWRWLRRAVAAWLARRVREKAHPDHYPAPYRLLELWAQHAGEEAEAISIGELLVSRTSRNLVHVFLLGEALKRQGRQRAHDIAHLHVVGAGVMGADIAMWAAAKGFSVSLQDKSHEVLARALARAHDFFRKQLREPRAVQAALDRLMPDLAGDGLRRADLVIEAIVEQPEAKQQLLRAIEPRLRPQAIIATNTSSIPLEQLAEALAEPARLVGLHFFNPVAKMQLVEVVRGERSGAEALARARAWCVAIEKLPLDVKSSPGFLVNRVLMPYLVEAVKMVEEGVPIEHIDRAARDFGMPMGPIELADAVGLDICLSVARILAGPLGIEVPERLVAMVEQGQLGKKSGAGFYRYDARGRIRGHHRGSGSEGRAAEVPVTERLILRLLNEAMACLREGIVADADAVDAGLVYGAGFAPFLGGPMRYAESLGETGISHSLYRLAQEYGPRFAPDPGWSQPGLLTRRAVSG